MENHACASNTSIINLYGLLENNMEKFDFPDIISRISSSTHIPLEEIKMLDCHKVSSQTSNYYILRLIDGRTRRIIRTLFAMETEREHHIMQAFANDITNDIRNLGIQFNHILTNEEIGYFHVRESFFALRSHPNTSIKQSPMKLLPKSQRKTVCSC